MALSNAERQARFRDKVRAGELARIDAKIPYETAAKLRYLADHWQCTKADALARCLLESWERAGCPITGYDPDDEAENITLSGNGEATPSTPPRR